MSLTAIQIFNFMGFQPAAARNAIIADFLSDGLESLYDMTDVDVSEACTSYAKRTDAPFPVMLSPILKKRLKSLVLWVKDRRRVGQRVAFPAATTRAQLVEELADSLHRQNRRAEQKKVGESFHDATFNNKLKSQSQWEKFNQELQATLSMIIGVNGVPLTYVIRDNDEPMFDETVPYDDAVIEAIALEGENYRIDAQTVHQIILSNVSEDSDAYTYIKTLLRYRNGRRDMLALRQRYSNAATKQAIINSAKSSLETLRYKNERSFPFERFSARLQKAYDELPENGRPVNNGDIVDALWDRIQTNDLQVYTASLKVDYQRNPRDYRLILQDLATEVSGKNNYTPNTRNVSAVYTRQGPCPNTGVHTPDGSIFIGSYDNSKWRDPSVTPFHSEILQARSGDANGQGKGQPNPNNDSTTSNPKRSAKALKRSKKKLKKLTKKIAAAKVELDSLKVSIEDNKAEDGNNDGNKAGNAFGGKASVRFKKGQDS